jgi:RNA polymerase sigma factor (sigma-70 family)
MKVTDTERSVELSGMIAAAQGGDKVAMGMLLRQYQPHLLRLARRRRGFMPAGQRPSDLVQDTLERVVRCLHQFQGQSEPELRRWLAVILENVLIQKRRAAGRKRRAAELVPLPDSDDLLGPDPPPGPSQSLRGREAWRALLRAIHALPEGQREAVRYHLRGEAVADIARAMNRTPAAVSCLLQRGGKTLQASLGEHGPLPAWFFAMRALLAFAD